MVSLLPKYCVSEKLNKQLKNLDIQHEDEKRDMKAEVLQAYLEVATNVTSYCRTLVSNSGKTSLCYNYCMFYISLWHIRGRVVRVVDLESLAPHCSEFECGQRLLSCEETIQLPYGMLVVLLRCQRMLKIMNGGVP